MAEAISLVSSDEEGEAAPSLARRLMKRGAASSTAAAVSGAEVLDLSDEEFAPPEPSRSAKRARFRDLKTAEAKPDSKSKSS